MLAPEKLAMLKNLKAIAINPNMIEAEAPTSKAIERKSTVRLSCGGIVITCGCCWTYCGWYDWTVIPGCCGWLVAIFDDRSLWRWFK